MESLPGLFDIEQVGGPVAAADDGLTTVASWLQGQPGMQARFASALRQSIDEVLDGQRTGRFDIATLEKTEKTYLGTKVEIVVRAEFGLGRGTVMDYRIAGHEVDAKFTIGSTWTIPREAMGHLCLVMAADDRRSTFRVGLLKITEQILNPGANQDGKRSVSVAGRGEIRWLADNLPLPENVLLQMRPVDRDAIFHASDGHRSGGNGGQLRINELLRRVQGRVIDRTTAITVASQLDGPKRVRDARHHLRPEGIVVLGHQQDHPDIARALGPVVPAKGSWVAVRLVRPPIGDLRPVAVISGRSYVVARPDEPPEPAPELY